MAKPSVVPRFVSDANAAGAPNAFIVEPTEAKKDAGWAAAQKEPAQQRNWLDHWLCKWAAWVDAESGTQTVMLGPGAGQTQTGDGWSLVADAITIASPMYWQAPAAVNKTLWFPLPVKAGDRLLTVKAIVDSSGSNFIGMKVIIGARSSGTTVQIGTTQSSSGTGRQELSVTIPGGDALVSNEYFWSVAVISGTAGTPSLCYGVVLTYDRP